MLEGRCCCLFGPPPAGHQGEVPSASEAEGVKAWSRPRLAAGLPPEGGAKKGPRRHGFTPLPSREGGDNSEVASLPPPQLRGRCRAPARRRGSRRGRGNGLTPLPALRRDSPLELRGDQRKGRGASPAAKTPPARRGLALPRCVRQAPRPVPWRLPARGPHLRSIGSEPDRLWRTRRRPPR